MEIRAMDLCRQSTLVPGHLLICLQLYYCLSCLLQCQPFLFVFPDGKYTLSVHHMISEQSAAHSAILVFFGSSQTTSIFSSWPLCISPEMRLSTEFTTLSRCLCRKYALVAFASLQEGFAQAHGGGNCSVASVVLQGTFFGYYHQVSLHEST